MDLRRSTAIFLLVIALIANICHSELGKATQSGATAQMSVKAPAKAPAPAPVKVKMQTRTPAQEQALVILRRERESARAQYRRIITDSQSVVQLVSSRHKAIARNEIKRLGFQIITEGAISFVIRSSPALPPNSHRAKIDALEASRIMRGKIQSIRADEIAVPLEQLLRSLEENCTIIRRKFSSVLPEPAILAKDVQRILAAAKDDTCHLFPRCGDNNPAWARMQMGADLADEIVAAELSLVPIADRKSKFAKLAVLDSGFDMNARNGLAIEDFSLKRAYDVAGRPDFDIGGHGTPVIGMAVAKGIGVTQFAKMESIRITEENSGGSVSNGMLDAAIEAACKENDIVNVSYGSLLDEISGKFDLERAWVQAAKKYGCIVVKSAGNSGVREQTANSAIPIEAPLLTVAALSKYSKEATFSTVGALSAPGMNVFTLLSSAKEDYSTNTENNSCNLNGVKIGPINGTSFASPAMQGILGQIVTILRARGVLPSDPMQKIALVKQIAYAAANWSSNLGGRPGQVNALAAALIARGVSSNNSSSVSIEELIQIGEAKATVYCENSSPIECQNIDTCAKKQACVHRLRLRLMICKDNDINNNLMLASLLESMQEKELLLELNSRLRDIPEFGGAALANLNAAWDDATTYFDKLQILSLANELGASSFIRKDKISELLQNYEFIRQFHSSFPIGKFQTNGGTEAMYEDFVRIFQSLPVAEQIELIQAYPFTTRESLIVSELGTLYVFHHYRDRLDPQVQAALSEALSRLGEDWFERKPPLDHPPHSLNFSFPVFELLVKHVSDGPNRIRASLKEPITDTTIHLHVYAQVSPDILNPTEKVAHAYSILKAAPDLKEFQYYELISQAILHYTSGTFPSRAAEKELADLLAANPHIGIPTSTFAYKGPGLQGNWFSADPEDWRNILRSRLETAQKIVLGEESSILLAHATSESLEAGFQIILGQDSLRNDILKKFPLEFEAYVGMLAANISENGDLYRKFPLASKEYTKIKYANKFFEQVLKELPRIKELPGDDGATYDRLVRRMRPLAVAILQEPEKFSPGMREDIRRLFNIDEICTNQQFCLNDLIPTELRSVRRAIIDTESPPNLSPLSPVNIPESPQAPPLNSRPPEQSPAPQIPK